MSDSRRLLLIAGKGKHARSVAQVLRTIAPELVVQESLPTEAVPSGYEVLLADLEALAPEERARLVAWGAAGRLPRAVLLLHAEHSRADLQQLLASGIGTNLVARNEHLDADELIVTIRKLLEADLFGIEKYFSWGLSPVTLRLTPADGKSAALDTAHRYATEIGVSARLAAHYRDVADEFLTAAFRDVAERQAVRPGETHPELVVKLGCDGRRLGIAVRDEVGGLNTPRLLEYLSRCFHGGQPQLAEPSEGAGLGYFFAFEWLSQFVVNIAPGKSTELIGLIDIRGSYKEFAQLRKSFNVFVAPG